MWKMEFGIEWEFDVGFQSLFETKSNAAQMQTEMKFLERFLFMWFLKSW